MLAILILAYDCNDITGAVRVECYRPGNRCQIGGSNGVADGPQSAIQQQVRNGVAVRMAVLATIVRNVQVRNVEAGRREG